MPVPNVPSPLVFVVQLCTVYLELFSVCLIVLLRALGIFARVRVALGIQDYGGTVTALLHACPCHVHYSAALSAQVTVEPSPGSDRY